MAELPERDKLLPYFFPSSAKSLRSQPASSASLLPAITYAQTRAGVRWPAHTVGMSRLDPAVASYDAARTVDQDRIDKAEFLDTGGNLFDLIWRVGAWIALAGLYKIYPVHAKTRKSSGEMTRKLSVTVSQ